ncbi:hypothetical protein MGG_04606 [Pyricularia oryzae 70-15]|uniref:F-box domain-containing protein n=1 Tax=Pyricularia oryzae (strain 70-15 / ATCC MYA-4617 / FGSC 8958) TaxID=242507 RepID=G4MSW0_PYRO7|nr:uncharacterized protein MGG_04606 [Pyricularia oryzae 70-15]EHA53814.1 hypothetical protein MGG_04606 [Pyricularia oryzae 70-15]
MTAPSRLDLLAEVPDDVILVIFAHMETARDMVNLAGSCKRLTQLLRERGWRIFARTRFPSLQIPREQTLKNPELSWAMLAESLTYQSRCWDRRSLNFTATVSLPPAGATFHHRQAQRWPSRCDAHYDVDTRSELLVWSEGEGFCARERRIVDDGWGEDRAFARFQGRDHGLLPGRDDIVDLSVVDGGLHDLQRKGNAVLAARASGWLDLRSAEQGDLGTLLATFRPRQARGWRESDSAAGRVLGQSSLLSMDVSGPGRIATNDRESVFVYDLPRGDKWLAENPPEVPPSLTIHKDSVHDKSELTHLGGVKWIGDRGETLALGINGQFQSALQYVQLSPSGKAYQIHRAIDNPAMSNTGRSSHQINAASILPLDVSSISNHTRPLVLAAWQDGTCRLQDLRTPTPFDAVYEDNVYPESNIQHLLTWGTERFIAGGPSDELLRIFDFRWTRGYYHTQALPCRSVMPYPDPPQPFASEESRRAREAEERRACCDHLAGFECTWHRQSRDIYHRPNCNIYFTRKEHRSGRGFVRSRHPSMEGVQSLAKGSDLCPSFYVGVVGGFLEARLGLQGTSGDAVDPNLSYQYLGLPGDEVGGEAAEAGQEGCSGTGYETVELTSSLMETGDGLSVAHNDRSIPLPPLRPNPMMRDHLKKGPKIPEEMVDCHRLDPRYQHSNDFGDFVAWKGSYGSPVR